MNESGAGAGEGRQPSEEELRAAMEEQLRRLRVEDVVLQTVATLVNLGGRRLGLMPDAEDERDLGQARVAIEATRALTPLLPEEEARAVREALSQLQVAYARAAGGAPGGTEETGSRPGGEAAAAGAGETPPRSEPASGESAQEPAERERARAKIWTPPGS